MCVCMYVCMYVCMHVGVYVYTNMYTYLSLGIRTSRERPDLEKLHLRAESRKQSEFTEPNSFPESPFCITSNPESEPGKSGPLVVSPIGDCASPQHNNCILQSKNPMLTRLASEGSTLGTLSRLFHAQEGCSMIGSMETDAQEGCSMETEIGFKRLLTETP